MQETKITVKQGSLLLVEDNLDIQLSVKLLLKQQYETVKAYDDPALAINDLRYNKYDLILLDMNFSRGETSGREGLHWLKKIMETRPGSQVVAITAYGDIDLAIKAIKLGAIDFVLKPWQNDKLLATLASAYKVSKSNRLQIPIQKTVDVLDKDYLDFIGTSDAMQRVTAHIDKVAPTDANVLILGENGTGKELVARAIHRKSVRSNGPFVKVDLGAIPESLFESELFGHKKGSFTDAREDRAGRFEAAHGGTLFLDEIGNVSLPLQAKLLTAIQSRQVIRVGTNTPINVDLRIICATNMPLYAMAGESTFRKDLLYRINTVEITIPPLRERKEDVSLLAAHYLDSYAKKYGKEKLSFSSSATKALTAYAWPGNVRELQHVLERAVILAEANVLQPDDFPIDGNTPGNTDPANDTLNLGEIERGAIKNALVKHQGNISQAAKDLGLTRAALYRRLEKYGL